MSWDQTYSVPSVESLLEKLTGTDAFTVLKEELERQEGIRIVNSEQIVLDDGFYQTVIGLKVTLSDGRVFVPKLVKKETTDGNWGCDIYEYMLESEEPKVEYIDNDEPEDLSNCSEGCGC